MAYSTRTYTPGSSTTTFALTTSGGDPIGYIQESDISVKVNGTTYTNAASGSNTYQISGTSTVEQPNGGNVVLNAGVTGTVILDRTTAIQDATVTYTAGSTLTATDLNNADNQIRFGLQEFSDDYAALFTGTGTLTSLGGFKGGSDTWVSSDAFAATTAAIDNRVDTKTTAKVKDDIIATAPVSIADDSPSAGKITISVDAKLTELATMDQNTANALADLTQAEVQILDGCTRSTAQLNYVDATSSIQTQIDGKQAADGDLTAIAALAKADGNIIVGDGSTWVAENGATARTSLGAQAAAADLTTLSSMQSGAATELASLTATELEILDGCTRTTAQLNYVDATSSIQTQLDAKQTLDAELTELATMSSGTASALADLSQTEVQILDDATVTTAELNVLDGIPGTLTATELGYVDGVTSAIQTQLDAKQPLDSDLTTLAGMQGATASILAGGTALTSTLTELNQLDGKTLGETSLTTNSNTAIPTSKAVADHVSSSVTAVGGFKAIAGPTNFPSTQPAQGVVVSISDVGSGFTTSSNEITITNGAGTGNNVRITGFPTSLAATTLQDDTGIQVTSDKNNSTSGSPNVHRYVYHKWLAKEDDVKALSDDINEFLERYRTDATGNNPTNNNHAGDLFFNQGSNTMYVRNGANNAWTEVTSSGDFKFLFLCPKNGGSGNPTFDGSETEFDLRDTSNTGTGSSVTSAAQLTVSVNGVVQKPNAGTSTSGLTGFVMLDTNTIKFCGAPANGDEIFVIQSGSAVTLNAPANNTVGTDQLMSQAVTEEKILISNAPSDGKYLQYKDSSDKLTWADVPAGVGGANAVTFNDNIKANWGTDADLQVWHNDTDALIYNTKGHTSISNSGTGNISIQAKHGEDSIKAIQDGGVELYYDDAKKLETYASGVEIHGTLQMDDNKVARFGNDGDLQIYHTGAHSVVSDRGGAGNLQIESNNAVSIKQNDAEHYMAKFFQGGTSELYYNNAKKLETTSDGVKVSSASNDAKLIITSTNQDGAPVLQFAADVGEDNDDYWRLRADGGGNAFSIQNYASGSWESNIVCRENGNVELYNDAAKKFETISDGAKVSGSWYNNRNTFIGTVASGQSTINIGTSGGAQIGFFQENTNDDSLRFYTHKSGSSHAERARITEDGHLIPGANNTYDLGSASAGWRNIYTNDLNLSNEGSNNDVDGSWGSFTIQEGEDDLFLINRRNGKKYKFNLTEVS